MFLEILDTYYSKITANIFRFGRFKNVFACRLVKGNYWIHKASYLILKGSSRARDSHLEVQ